MIYGDIENIEHYRGISTSIDKALQFLKEGKYPQKDTGRMELDGSAYVIRVSEQLGKENSWEAHRRYIDIHFSLEKGEKIDCCDLKYINGWSQYDVEKDSMVSKASNIDGNRISVNMLPGHFLILFPEDAHKTGLALTEEKEINKIIIKVEA